MAVTGWKVAGTGASVDRDGEHAWSSPTLVQACDDSYTSCDIDKTAYSDWLRCTNFGFTVVDIPAGSTIDGIEVKIQRYAEEADKINDSVIKLRKTVGQVGDNKASATFWATTEEEVTYGGAADDWNAGLVDTDIVNINFGIDISAYNTSGADLRLAFIDCVSIRVNYTAPAAGWTGKISGVTDPAKVMGVDVADIAEVKGVA